MIGLNRYECIGRVGQDPEMRYTPNGTAVVNISVAVKSGYDDQEKVLWIKVVCWQKLAENVNQYVNKGSMVRCRS